MKKFLLLLMPIFAGVGLNLHGASVGATGYTTAFDARPAAADWSTLSIAGASAGITNFDGLDAAIQTNFAGRITAQLNASNANPANAVGPAIWNTNGYVQTRPTGNSYSLLLAHLVNTTGSNVTTINISYDFTTNLLVAEEVLGQRVYYSFTGQPDSWINVPEFSSQASGRLSVSLGETWNDQTPLYVLFADDNGSGAPDTACQIDNFSVSTSGGGPAPTSITITSPTNGQSIVQGARFAVNGTATGTAVTNTGFYLDGALVGSDTTVPYSVTHSNVSLGAHTLTAVANLSVTSPPVSITIVPNNPPTVTLTSSAGGSILVGLNTTNVATVSDSDPGGSIVQVEFYLDGALRVTDTSSPYTFEYCDPIVGTHSISAVAVDQLSARGTNSISLIVTNPTGVTLLITNGSRWKYLDDGTDPGSSWPTAVFNDSGWSNGVAELGYGDAAGNNRPEVTVLSFGTNANAKFPTTYFRKSFTVASPSAFTNLIFRILRDDGAIVYLNGTEVFRTAITNPVVTSSTYTAPAVPDDGSIYQVTNISPALLVSGANLVAVEIHQDATNSSDISFDLMLWAQSPEGVRLALTPINATHADVSWPFPSTGYVLESKLNLNAATWDLATDLDAPDANFHHVSVNPSTGKRFFRLRQP